MLGQSPLLNNVSPLVQFLSASYLSLLPYTSQTGLLGTDVQVVYCIQQTEKLLWAAPGECGDSSPPSSPRGTSPAHRWWHPRPGGYSQFLFFLDMP